ncbi:sulfate adenylyltransferase subunit 1 [Pontibacter roseus]|uniref:sulfate adenylyltransferase subunit 1 n=1 Tax=Pontibacter roseus TaxID=336989 RepID=UPI000368C581|nr:GTP-binding protein [Pontibacter roseus]
MDILRLIIAGSVDNGKSTLMGRLLYDSKSVMQDQLEAMEKHSRSQAAGCPDLALLTDGLRAEREQGITIDVAYKYFSTTRRKFILADAPGHVQYTRNMVTGCSNSDLAVIMVDARHGLVEQTNRHTLIASMLGVPHLVVAINKMDLVDYAQERFEQITSEFSKLTQGYTFQTLTFIPMCALQGDNVVQPSTHMPWYQGPTLLRFLEQVEVRRHTNLSEARFPVQYVIRQQTSPDYRGYAGKIISGSYRKGDVVRVLPVGMESVISAVEVGGQKVEEACAPRSVVLRLADSVEVKRGDVIVKPDSLPTTTQELEVMLCWLDNKPLLSGNNYLLQLNSSVVQARVGQVAYRVNVTTLRQEPAPEHVAQNDVVKTTLHTDSPLPHDAYTCLRENGGAILIDKTNLATVGACMIQ